MSTACPTDTLSLIVPRGRAGARPKLPQAESVSVAPMLSKRSILQISKAHRPTLTVAQPWARLTASALAVPGRAKLIVSKCPTVWPGPNDYINMCSFGLGEDAELLLILSDTVPGQMFVAEIVGRCDERGGALTCTTGTGRTDAELPPTAFNLPVAIISNHPEAWLRMSIKTTPRQLLITTIKVWKVD